MVSHQKFSNLQKLFEQESRIVFGLRYFSIGEVLSKSLGKGVR